MTHDFTKGPILGQLVRFTIPLILGTILQLTYNMADSVIVGRFVGKTALAAVGTTNPLVTLVLLFTNGICLGAGILVSTLYGAGKLAELRRQVSTGLIAGIVFSVTVSILMMLLAEPLLTLLQVEAVFFRESVHYLRIILFGIVFSFLYNYLASMLRAMGDSRSPLIFLAVSAALNIGGDLLFVVCFHMGVRGAALSTVVCEMMSAVLCLVYIHREIPELRLGKAWLVFDRGMLRKTVSYGFVSAMQQSTVQLGKLGTQAIVNTMGVNATAAFNATNRFDDFATIPQQNIAHAMTSVMAQNEGAGKKRRAAQTYRLGMILEVFYGLGIGGVTYFAAHLLIRLFTRDPGVIVEGEKYLRLIALFYVLPGITNGVQGYFRGIGDLNVTLWSSILNMAVRVLSEIPMVFYLGMQFEAIPWSYLFGWAAMCAFEIPWLVRTMRRAETGTEKDV